MPTPHPFFASMIVAACCLTSCRQAPIAIPPPELLPSGWSVSPAGETASLPELPLGCDVTPDGRFAAILCCGTGDQALVLFDVAHGTVSSITPMAKAWLGVRFFDAGRQLIAAAGNDNELQLFAHEAGRLTRVGAVSLGATWEKGGRIWPAGIAIDHERGLAYVACREDRAIRVIDLENRRVLQSVDVGGVSYACAVSGNTVAVSLWGDARVALLDAQTWGMRGVVTVNEHPCALTFDATGERLFVACANDNTVSVIATDSLRVEEILSTALAADLPPGSTPNALSYDASEGRLYVANADTNCVTVFDVGTRAATKPLGFLPTGWYPTDVAVTDDALIVLDGKGFRSAPNPAALATASFFQGGVQVLAKPDTENLARTTAAVYRNSRVSQPATPVGYPLRASGERPAPIKHVFYVLKENKTYDAVFGDLEIGNGKREYCIFPEAITPNQHALAREFVLLDNFYVDAEVSADGHNWSMGAYATDWVEKSWPTHYGGRGGTYDDEWLGDGIEKPRSGYLWDLCRRNAVTFRNYGEYARNPAHGDEPVTALSASLRDVTCPTYCGWDLRSRDLDRLAAWQREFDQFEQRGGLPQLSLIYLPDDHGAGSASGHRTMRAMVAENDLAVGKLVERISHSRFWPECAIFILEDDAQGGADHVDLHRSVAFVISPFAHRHAIDHTLYSTTSMLHTVELILGLPPMSQFDSSSTPMQASFQQEINLEPFTAREPRVMLGEMNAEHAEFQDECDRMDLSAPDRAPDRRYAEIIWATLSPAQPVMPPACRAAFVQVAGTDADDDDD